VVTVANNVLPTVGDLFWPQPRAKPIEDLFLVEGFSLLPGGTKVSGTDHGFRFLTPLFPQALPRNLARIASFFLQLRDLG
jgi:hypothetical protein